MVNSETFDNQKHEVKQWMNWKAPAAQNSKKQTSNGYRKSNPARAYSQEALFTKSNIWGDTRTCSSRLESHFSWTSTNWTESSSRGGWNDLGKKLKTRTGDQSWLGQKLNGVVCPMGKAAQRRKASQIKYLKGLAENDPRRFEKAVDRRTISWLYEIERRKGNMSVNSPSVFSVVDNAMVILDGCGRKVFKELGPDIKKSLDAACCKAFDS